MNLKTMNIKELQELELKIQKCILNKKPKLTFWEEIEENGKFR